MSAGGSPSQVIVTHHYDALAPERVFDAFVTIAVARHFLFATPCGDMLVAAVDARVGGAFEFIERRPDMGDVRHIGDYLVIDRPRRLAFTFGVPQFAAEFSTVAIDLCPDAGGCRLTLTHDDILPDYIDGTREGWCRILAGLALAYDGVHAAGWR